MTNYRDRLICLFNDDPAMISLLSAIWGQAIDLKRTIDIDKKELSV